jgi:hypothetical protein
MRAAIILVAVAACRNGAAIALPPALVTTGLAAPVARTADVRGPSDEVLAGLSWASLAWRPTSVDVGAGYVGSFRPLVADERLRANGGYLDLAYALANDAHARTWLSWRGELLSVRAYGQHFAALGTALRVSTELYARAAFFKGGNGAAVGQSGSWAIGAYAEASGRELPGQLGPASVAAGLTLRVPLFFAGTR